MQNKPHLGENPSVSQPFSDSVPRNWPWLACLSMPCCLDAWVDDFIACCYLIACCRETAVHLTAVQICHSFFKCKRHVMKFRFVLVFWGVWSLCFLDLCVTCHCLEFSDIGVDSSRVIRLLFHWLLGLNCESMKHTHKLSHCIHFLSSTSSLHPGEYMFLFTVLTGSMFVSFYINRLPGYNVHAALVIQSTLKMYQLMYDTKIWNRFLNLCEAFFYLNVFFNITFFR